MKPTTAFISFLILVFTTLVMGTSHGQIVFSDWVAGQGTKGWDIVNDLACDASGNIFITGSHTDTTQKPTTSSRASTMRKCMFIARYDTSGKLIWSKDLMKPAAGFGTLLSLDVPDQIILAGGTEPEKKQGKMPPGRSDFFLLSMDTAGKVTWKVTLSGTRNDFLTSMVVDTLSREILLAGYFNDSLRVCGKRLTSGGKTDGFLCRFDMKGALKEAKVIGGKGADNLQSLTVTTNGHLIMAGTFQQTVRFGNKRSLELPDPHKMAVYLSKYNPAGDLISVKQIMSGKKLRIDAMSEKQGLIFLTGSFSDDLAIGNQLFQSRGSDDIFVVCLDPDLELVWQKQIGGPQKDRVAGMILRENGLILTGSFCSELSIDQVKQPGTGRSSDLFVLALNTSGSLSWIRQAGGEAADYPCSIAYGSGKYIYVAGSFRQTFNLGVKTVSSKGEEDLFICRLEDCRVLSPTFDQPETLCEGATLQLDAGEGFISYDWAGGEGHERLFDIDRAGFYPLELVAPNGCMLFDTIEVADTQLPAVFIGNDTTIADTARILLSPGESFAHYLWNNGDTTPVTLLKGADLKEGPNPVTLTVTGEAGCSGTDGMTITIVRTLPGHYSELISESCFLFPNPATDQVTVYFTLSLESLTLSLHDQLGKEMKTWSYSGYHKSDLLGINLGGMPKGMYTLHIKTDRGVAAKKIVLQ